MKHERRGKKREANQETDLAIVNTLMVVRIKVGGMRDRD